MAKRKSKSRQPIIKYQAWCRHCGLQGEPQATAKRAGARANEHADKADCGGSDTYVLPVTLDYR